LRDLLTFHQSLAQHLCGDLGLDEGKSLGSVLVDVLLVGVGVVAVAAVWVGRIAVRLDDGGTGRCALEARWASSEL
jgi:Mn2+/Fe2+ NRAMP family transporter